MLLLRLLHPPDLLAVNGRALLLHLVQLRERPVPGHARARVEPEVWVLSGPARRVRAAAELGLLLLLLVEVLLLLLLE